MSIGWERLASTTCRLFVVVDPIGTGAIYAALSPATSTSARAAIAIGAPFGAYALLALTACRGPGLLSAFQIDLPTLHMAGGMILVVVAASILAGTRRTTTASAPWRLVTVVYLLAGPGCMATTVLQRVDGEDQDTLTNVLIALALVEASALVCLLSIPPLIKRLDARAIWAFSWIAATLLAVMGLRALTSGLIGS